MAYPQLEVLLIDRVRPTIDPILNPPRERFSVIYEGVASAMFSNSMDKKHADFVDGCSLIHDFLLDLASLEPHATST